MNLNDIRVAVRAQLDVDEEELPNPLIDLYAQDGFEHVINLETRWPFYEKRWNTMATDGVLTVPSEAREVVSVVGPNGRLERIDQLHVDRNFPTTPVGTAQFWSQMANFIEFYPAPAGDVTMILRGYRAPTNWVAEGAGGEVDADPRLHLAIVWFCCAAAYAQQEDEVLEQTYTNRFQETATIGVSSIMRPWSGRPKIFNGYRFPQYRSTQPPVVFNVPPPEQA